MSIGEDLNSFCSTWEAALSVPEHNNNEYDLRSQSPLLAEFEDDQHISQPNAHEDYSGEQFYSNTRFEPPNTVSQHVHWSDVDCQIDEGSLSTGTPMTAEQTHHQSDCDGKAVCNQCSQPFPHKSALDKHAKQTRHKAHACSCGITFTRFDVLNRHVQSFNPKTVYPCSYCSKYTGMSAFTRRDHLTQHLRGFHKIEISTGRGERS
ncbi:hypothetical protein N431DRAFT_53088 [Stipitochalara longipes BDJ]|nr:hypothetical protein N431DRAFT_53088 [Stipitochalara longipes BDJ]